MSKLNIPAEKTVKLFFKGKILLDDINVADYSKYYNNIEFTTNDVVLYMISELPKNEEQASILTQNVEAVDVLHNRGFNMFRQFGLDPVEIHMMRIIFHANFINGRGGISKYLII